MWGWVSDQDFRGYNLQLIVVYMAIFKFVKLLQFPHVIIFISGTIAGFDFIVIQFLRWLTQRSRHFWLCIHFWASEYIISDENSAINLAPRREQKGVAVAESKSHMHFPRWLKEYFTDLGTWAKIICLSRCDEKPTNKLVGHYLSYIIGWRWGFWGTWLPGPTANQQ